MGQAKRKQGWGFGFDPNKKVIAGCYIGPAVISDRHAVYLGIRRKNNPIVINKPLSVHTNVIAAWKILEDCIRILSDFSFRSSDMKNVELFRQMLHDTYGDRSEEPDRYEVAGDLNAFSEWIGQGHFRNKDEVPQGVFIRHLTPLVKARYKVFCIPFKQESEKFCGNPDDNCVFHVGDRYQPLMGESNETFVWQNYVHAAYVADYANTHNKDYLTSAESQALTEEAKRLFGKV